MSYAQGYPNTFSETQQTQEVLHNLDNEVKKIYTNLNEVSNTLVSAANVFYPVGCVYTSVLPTSPADLFGVGIWTSIGAGKVLIGVDTGDTDFNTVEKTGGSKAGVIQHTHAGPYHAHNTAGVGLDASQNGPHTHAITLDQRQGNDVGDTGFGWCGDHVNNGSRTLTSGSSGTGAAHYHGDTGFSGSGNTGAMSVSPSVVQPYFTVYMWKRVS